MSEEEADLFYLSEVSEVAKRTFNPIRNIVDRLKGTKSSKSFLSLGLGDPTVIPVPPGVKAAVRDALEGDQANGYPPAVGLLSARQALATQYSQSGRPPLSPEDCFIGSGCSGALEMLFGCLPPGRILLPRPGFSFYAVLARNKGLEIDWYDLQADQQWEIDLESVSGKLARGGVCAWLLNNPSNPCGSVYSREHLQACLRLAKRHRVLIIADEIYEAMTFEAGAFCPIASLQPSIPLAVVSAISKRWLVPGWRLGWILVYDDERGSLRRLREALTPMAGVILGANSLIQAALPRILTCTDHLEPLMKHLATNAKTCYDLLSNCSTLKPIPAAGTMYMMVKLPEGCDDVAWCEGLMQQENVLCLPGTIFEMPGYFRIVYVASSTVVKEACQRILAYAASN